MVETRTSFFIILERRLNLYHAGDLGSFALRCFTTADVQALEIDSVVCSDTPFIGHEDYL